MSETYNKQTTLIAELRFINESYDSLKYKPSKSILARDKFRMKLYVFMVNLKNYTLQWFGTSYDDLDNDFGYGYHPIKDVALNSGWSGNLCRLAYLHHQMIYGFKSRGKLTLEEKLKRARKSYRELLWINIKATFILIYKFGK